MFSQEILFIPLTNPSLVKIGRNKEAEAKEEECIHGNVK